MNAITASTVPMTVASRSGATEKAVTPSIDSPISRRKFQVLRPSTRGAGS